ncbi:hypothetical protein JHK82_039693 [Glycine max]|nr:hypothetical protein JHK86_039887 [Glycine max]KAG4965492.1 hypothetical protein JHK85_040467 [Glycine max]KAG5110470.1 hypothetical protein JHK82_039693 [Glycine max]KAG5121758.1 hypothetical protein JHK84_040098 [Glycine max]
MDGEDGGVEMVCEVTAHSATVVELNERSLVSHSSCPYSMEFSRKGIDASNRSSYAAPRSPFFQVFVHTFARKTMVALHVIGMSLYNGQRVKLDVWAKEREVVGLKASLNTLMSEIQRLNKLCAERKEAKDSLKKKWKKIEEFDARRSEFKTICMKLLKANRRQIVKTIVNIEMINSPFEAPRLHHYSR